jgi:hypothetical protein
MGRFDKSEEAFSTAKSLGYNETVMDYLLQSEPLLMTETKKKSPGFWAGMAVFVIFVARAFVRSKKR